MNCAAQNVHLLLSDGSRKVFALLKMDPVSPDCWSLGVRLDPGVYRYRYYAGVGRVTTYVCPRDSSSNGADLHLDGLDALRCVGA